MQNADTTQFFWGDLVQYISTTTTYPEIVSSPSSSRSSSTLNFPFRVDTFFVVFLCHLDFRLLCEQDFLGGKNDQKQAASLSHCCYSFPQQQPQTSQERIEAVDQDSRVNFLKQPLATSKKQPRMSELSHSTTSAAAIKQRIHSSSVCSTVDVVQFVLMSFF